MSRLALFIALNLVMVQVPALAHALDSADGTDVVVACAKKATKAVKAKSFDADFELSDFETGDYHDTEIKAIEAKKAAPKAMASDKAAALKAASRTSEPPPALVAAKAPSIAPPPVTKYSALTPAKPETNKVTAVQSKAAIPPAAAPAKPPIAKPAAAPSKPADTHVFVQGKPVDHPGSTPSKPSDRTESAGILPVSTPAADSKPAETKPTASDSRPTEAKPTTADSKPAETKPTENKDTSKESKPEADTDTPPAEAETAREPFGPWETFGPPSPPQTAAEPKVDRSDWITLGEARNYMLSLINRDREANGLKPVELDRIATIAGQSHSEDMALSKYVSHWDLQGRKPDQRFTEAGGQGAVAENIALNHGFVDGQTYRMDEDQRFKKSELEKIEGLFFNELPPVDGHRRNILDSAHNKVGIGLTLAQPGNRVTCTQEFVNQYGSFTNMPNHNLLSESLDVQGKLENGLTVYAVDVYREDAPQAMSRDQIKYPVPYTYPTENVAHYFPAPYISPAPIKTKKSDGIETFSVDVKPNSSWKPGLYYVVVWAKKPDSSAPILCCTHTVDLQAAAIVTAP